MARIEQEIEVSVPVSTAYNQWTQFEEFPRFMEGVEQVTQMGDKNLHWVADVMGQRREWDAKIIEQVPDQRIAWRNTTGTTNAGYVSFFPIDVTRSRVRLEVDWDPEGFAEKAGSALGMVQARVKDDLQRFKQLIEQRGVETGAWRGEIHEGTQAPLTEEEQRRRAS